jgi:hypothetical protein
VVSVENDQFGAASAYVIFFAKKKYILTGVCLGCTASPKLKYYDVVNITVSWFFTTTNTTVSILICTDFWHILHLLVSNSLLFWFR